MVCRKDALEKIEEYAALAAAEFKYEIKYAKLVQTDGKGPYQEK